MPLARLVTSPPPAYSFRGAKEWKGTFSFNAHRFLARIWRVSSLIAKCRERVVKSRVCPVNAYEERMGKACYAGCGDQLWWPSPDRHQATKQQGGTDVTGQLRIIVLDTSPTTRKILEVILQREGHLALSLTHFRSGERSATQRRFAGMVSRG